jgi:hypothetical protein
MTGQVCHCVQHGRMTPLMLSSVWEGWLLGEWNREESRDTLEIVFGFTRRTPLLCFSCPAVASRGCVTTSWPSGSIVSLCSTTPLPTRTPLPLYLNDSTPGSVKEGTTHMGDSKYRYCRGAGDAVPLVWDVEIAVHDRSSDVSWRVACSTCVWGEVGGCFGLTRSCR